MMYPKKAKNLTRVMANTCLMLLLMFSSCSQQSDEAKFAEVIVSHLEEELSGAVESRQDENYLVSLIIEDQLADISKGKYRPIKITADTISKTIASILGGTTEFVNRLKLAKEQSEKNKIYDEYVAYLVNQQEQITHHVMDLMENNAKVFGLKEVDLDAREQYVSEVLIPTIMLVKAMQEARVKIPSYRLFKHLLRDNIVKAESRLLEQLFVTTGSRVSFEYHYHPIVLSSKEVVSLGEEFNAEIAVGFYFSPHHNHSEMTLWANGEKLKLKDNGRASFTEKPVSDGLKEIVLKFELKDKITGEVYESSGNYFYNVVDIEQ